MFCLPWVLRVTHLCSNPRETILLVKTHIFSSIERHLSSNSLASHFWIFSLYLSTRDSHQPVSMLLFLPFLSPLPTTELDFYSPFLRKTSQRGIYIHFLSSIWILSGTNFNQTFVPTTSSKHVLPNLAVASELQKLMISTHIDLSATLMQFDYFPFKKFLKLASSTPYTGFSSHFSDCHFLVSLLFYILHLLSLKFGKL